MNDLISESLESVTSILERSLKTETCSFASLIADAAGLFPTEVLQFLEHQRDAKTFDNTKIEKIIAEAYTLGSFGIHHQGEGLALPHPLDAEWRFTEETSQALLNMAIDATKPSDLILLVGVPSIAMTASRRADDRRYLVWGEENIITDDVRRGTAGDERFCHTKSGLFQAATAIVDPPWYLPEFRDMLGQASFHCRPGALILVSTPGEGVRPSIRAELNLVAESASQAGLVLSGREDGMLRYRTPLFELNALRAAGIGAWLPEWRRGNLLQYRKQSAGQTWPQVTKPLAFELSLGGVRLRLLCRKEPEIVTGITPVHPGEIFPSVSARASRRAEATLWTTGNRAFSAAYGPTLLAMLEIAALRKVLPKGLDEELSRLRNRYSVDGVEPLIQKLLALADREAVEAASLLGPLAWERSANDARFLNDS